MGVAVGDDLIIVVAEVDEVEDAVVLEEIAPGEEVGQDEVDLLVDVDALAEEAQLHKRLHHKLARVVLQYVSLLLLSYSLILNITNNTI